MIFLKLHILFPWGERQRLEPHASTVEELAQDLIVMQTHGLDADNQAFKADDKQVAEDNGDPETEIRFLASQREDGKAQAPMRYGESTHTHKGKCVAEQADDRFKQVHEGLHEEHHAPANATSLHGSMTFHGIAECA